LSKFLSVMAALALLPDVSFQAAQTREQQLTAAQKATIDSPRKKRKLAKNLGASCSRYCPADASGEDVPQKNEIIAGTRQQEAEARIAGSFFTFCFNILTIVAVSPLALRVDAALNPANAGSIAAQIEAVLNPAPPAQGLAAQVAAHEAALNPPPPAQGIAATLAAIQVAIAALPTAAQIAALPTAAQFAQLQADVATIRTEVNRVRFYTLACLTFLDSTKGH
jgi:hypothetical protein